jgi:hypothetical protein
MELRRECASAETQDADETGLAAAALEAAKPATSGTSRLDYRLAEPALRIQPLGEPRPPFLAEVVG